MKKLICAVTVLAVSTAEAGVVIHVDAGNCPGPGDGSELDPYCSIQTAIDNAVDTDEIVVAPGAYFETINFLGKAIWLHSSNGPETTIIDGTGFFHVVQCVGGEGPDTVLDGFTITGGNANGTFPDNLGGGMNNSTSDPTVTNCTFSGNSGTFGGGMYNVFSSPTVTNCSFSGNSATSIGGGMRTLNGTATVINCTFIDNTAGTFGGGMANHNSNLTTVTNCLFIDNTAGTFGGGMFNSDSSPTLTNCTFSGNTAKAGGALYSINGSHPAVTNCVLWGDIPDDVLFPTTTVTYSNVQGGFPGTGNIDADPLFVDPDNGDFRLQAGSPCIDAGDNTAVPKGVLRDLDGNPRFVADACAGDSGATVDMGAYEFQGTSCDLSNTLALLATWGHCDDCGNCPADFDGDCSVGILDLLILLGNWG